MALTPPPVPQLAVGVFVFDTEGRLLLIERGRPPGQGLWSVPGGKVEWGESIVGACRREVFEETGVDIEIGPLVTWVEHMDDTHHYVILDFTARPKRPAELLVPGGDAAAARWVTPHELGRLPLTTGLLSVLQQARVIAGLDCS